MPGRFFFRLDANRMIGSGHFMRCLTLANALKRAGAGEIFFLCRDLPSHFAAMLSREKHGLFPLPPCSGSKVDKGLAHAAWLGTSREEDARACLDRLGQMDPDGSKRNFLIVDHYGLDRHWELAMRHHCHAIMVIDDLADRNHDCDLLLDQNRLDPRENPYKGKIPAHCILLLGPRYALLRRQFRKLRKIVAPRKGPFNRVLVFFGGVDEQNQTAAALAGLTGLHKKTHVDVVIGAANPHLDTIRGMCRQHGHVLHVQTNQMARLMARADLAIGAAGSSSWERCCLGLPSLLVTLASNQEGVAQALARLGACHYLGQGRELTAKDYTTALTNLLGQPEELARIAARASGLVDGLGTRRVVKWIVQERQEIKLRPARQNDADFLFRLRNDPVTRKASLGTEELSFSNHCRWLKKALANPSMTIYIAEMAEKPVGTVRLEQAGKAWEVSWTVAPECRGKGIGGRMVARLLATARVPVRATIRNKNHASLELARQVGMVLKDRNDTLSFFVRPAS